MLRIDRANRIDDSLSPLRRWVSFLSTVETLAMSNEREEAKPWAEDCRSQFSRRKSERPTLQPNDEQRRLQPRRTTETYSSYVTSQLVPCLPHRNSRIVRPGPSRVRIEMTDELPDIVLEVGDDSRIRVEGSSIIR